MPTPIIMPKFGQMTEESTIVSWLKKEGDQVAKGDILFEVETDKSVMEVESFAEGTLLKIVVPVGVSVPVQTTVGFLGQPGETVSDVNTATAGPALVTSAATPPTPHHPITPSPHRTCISPRAACLAEKFGIDPVQLRGTGPNGRIIEKDVQAHLDAKQPGAEKPLSKMRQVIGQRLTQSVLAAPHFYVTVSVDMTELMQFRAEMKAQGAPFTLTEFIAKAVVLALKEFPDVNSATDGKTVRSHGHVHLGLAVSLEEGLVVPVLRNADELTLSELSRRSKELAAKARAGKLRPDEMTGKHVYHFEHGHAGRGEFHRDHQPRRERDPRGLEHDETARRAWGRDRGALDDEDDIVVRSSHHRRRDGGPICKRGEEQA